VKLIQTITLGSAASSIEFTSIPQTFTDLVILCSLRGTSAGVHNASAMYFNSAASDSRAVQVNGDGTSTPAVTALGTQNYIGWGNATGTASTANVFGSGQIYIPNYTGNQRKTISAESVSENNSSNWGQGGIAAGFSTKSAAITLINIYVVLGGNWVAGSTISLYGILKGSDGITTAS